MSKDQMVQAIRVANVPAEDFEKQVESPTPPTVTALAEQGKKATPKPVIDLKGRDPAEFNRAMHFVGAFEAYQRDIEKIDADAALTILVDAERDRIRRAGELLKQITPSQARTKARNRYGRPYSIGQAGRRRAETASRQNIKVGMPLH